MASLLIEPLIQRADRWRAVTRASRWRATLAVASFGMVVALLAARGGTPLARSGGAIVLLATLAFSIGWRTIEHRRLRDPRRILRGPVGRIDRGRADRALRALSLLGPDGEVGERGTSAELARVHVVRAFDAIPLEPLGARAAQIALRVGIFALGLGVVVVALLLAKGWSVVEGADVFLARRGVAPVAIQWLDDVDVDVRPPDYLHQNALHGIGRSPLLLPYGSSVTVRGSPSHAGRRLLLSDGVVEIPFADDGAGGVVARYSLHQSRVLRVVARFGEVVIPESENLPVTSIADEAPVVQLEGAPRQLRLLGATEDIAVKYEASDDHGLREVQLVLRSGIREERRVLARLDGETRSDEGGRVLKLRDPFLNESHVPVEVTVEAKDNDPLTGPKWGASAAITVIPPDVGEPEARQLDALRKVRDALVDALASRLENEIPADASERKAFLARESRLADEDERALDETLGLTLAGVRLPARVRAVLGAQGQKVRAAIDAEIHALSEPARESAVKATERFVLVMDAVIRGLGQKDARGSAKELADVADDLALGAGQTRNDAANMRSRGTERMDAATSVLVAGGKDMLRMGELGRDLGEIVDADVLRVGRARQAKDLAHAELAARDLSARLRQPDPSFGSRNGLQRAGGESGGAKGTPADGDEGEPSDDVEQAFDEAAQDLERLAQDHAGGMSAMEDALRGATSEDERQEMRDDAKRHAAAIREAERLLPTVGMGSDSWTSKGAAARDLAEQMARSLEEGKADDAVQSGRSAVGSLDEAKKMLQRGGWLDDPSGTGQRGVDEARRRLDAESRWAEAQSAEARRRAAERARGQLEQGGEEEDKLADRARELGQKGHREGALPEQAVESVDEAERAARQAAAALKRGDADEGLERQREAQRHLEAAQQELRGDEDNASRSDQGNEGAEGRSQSREDVAIPKANEHKGPEDFRRRVLMGLGQSSNGGLRDAVRRYAEGLLR